MIGISLKDSDQLKKAQDKSSREPQDLPHQIAELIDFLPDATFIIDNKGIVVAWNKAMEELTDTNAKNVIGKSNYEYSIPFYGERRPLIIDFSLSPQEGFEKRYSYFERKGDTLVVKVFVPLLKQGGAYLWAKARPLYNAQGEVIGAIEIIRDITEQTIADQRLKERVKELNCLFGIIKLFNTPNITVDEILHGTLSLLPNGWEFPELVTARIIFDGREYKPRNFTTSAWSISSKTLIKDKELVLELYYKEQKSFLKEEEELLNEIANQLKAIFEFKLFWVL